MMFIRLFSPINLLLFFLLSGVLNLPAVAVGIFLGGLLMRRYKLSVVSGAQLSFATSFMGYLLLLLQFGTKCDNRPVAGLTVSYNGSALRQRAKIQPWLYSFLTINLISSQFFNHLSSGHRVYHSMERWSFQSVTETALARQMSGILFVQTRESLMSRHAWQAASAQADAARTQ